MNEVEKHSADLEEIHNGLSGMIRRHRYAALSAGALASVGATMAGPVGSAVGGALGGLVGFALDNLTTINESLGEPGDDFAEAANDAADLDPNNEDV